MISNGLVPSYSRGQARGQQLPVPFGAGQRVKNSSLVQVNASQKTGASVALSKTTQSSYEPRPTRIYRGHEEAALFAYSLHTGIDSSADTGAPSQQSKPRVDVYV